MHGIGISEDILKIVKRRAKEKGLSQVKKLKIRIGEMYMVGEEEILKTFDMVSKGTIAEGASIKVDIVPLAIKCSECEKIVQGKQFSLSCPNCGSMNLGVLSGEELIVEGIES